MFKYFWGFCTFLFVFMACDPLFRLYPVEEKGKYAIREYGQCVLKTEVLHGMGGTILVRLNFQCPKHFSLFPKQLKAYLNSDSLKYVVLNRNANEDKILLDSGRTEIEFRCSKPGVIINGHIVNKGDILIIYATDFIEVENRMYNLDSISFVMP